MSASLKIIFCGTGAFGLPAFEALLASNHRVALVVTQPDRPAGRHRELKPSPIKVRALAARLPVFQPEKLSDPASVATLREVEPDVMVVVSYGQILRPDVLALPRLHCVNLHGSVLPRHRGASPVQAAILAGDTHSGTTSMVMDKGLDTGPILMVRTTPVGARETAPELHDRLAALGGEIIVPTLDGLAAGTLKPVPQDGALATVCRTLTKEDGVIDWSVPALEVDRRVRAMVPWPAAEATLLHRGERLRLHIHRAEPIPGESGAPGTLVTSHGRFEVACGTGSLRLLQIKPEGRPLMEADAFLRGRSLGPDDRMLVETQP